MKKPTILVVFAATFVLTTTACLHAKDIDDEELAQVSAALVKVSQAVHTTVLYKTPDPAWQDRALLDAATAHNPALLDRFSAYVMKARQDGHLSSVMVCTADGQHALVEDAGCTGASDWRTTEASTPCTFTLDLSDVCATP